MPKSSSARRAAADLTLGFLAELHPNTPSRLEAKVASGEGMSVLCAVEAALAQALPRSTAQELVWLSGAPAAGAEVLHLRAFGPGNQILAEAVHQLDA